MKISRFYTLSRPKHLENILAVSMVVTSSSEQLAATFLKVGNQQFHNYMSLFYLSFLDNLIVLERIPFWPNRFHKCNTFHKSIFWYMTCRYNNEIRNVVFISVFKYSRFNGSACIFHGKWVQMYFWVFADADNRSRCVREPFDTFAMSRVPCFNLSTVITILSTFDNVTTKPYI